MSSAELTKGIQTVLDNLPPEHRRRGAAAGAGATIGAVVGSLLGGPVGAAIGAGLGGALGVVAQDKAR